MMLLMYLKRIGLNMKFLIHQNFCRDSKLFNYFSNTLRERTCKKNRKIYLNVNPRNFQKVSLPNVIQITKRNAESILTALGFQVLEYNYVDDIGKDMVLDVLYEGEKFFLDKKFQ